MIRNPFSILFFLLAVSFAANARQNKVTTISDHMDCGDYLIRGWIKLDAGIAYLVIAKGTQSENSLVIPPTKAPEVLLLADQAVNAKITLVNNRKMSIEPQSKTWIQPRIVNIRDEINLRKLVQLEKKTTCRN